MNSMQWALIRKDMRAMTSNKRLFSVLLIVPLVMTVVLPSVFLLMMAFAPEDVSGMEALIALLPASMQGMDMQQMAIRAVLDYIMPVFFLMIPIMGASVMAASSFVGEKEKRTLETLLYSPMTLKEIYQAKVLASFILSMAVSLLSFAAMILVVEIEAWFITGALLLPGINWLVLMLLVAPAIALLAIALIVRGSAKAQTVEESQQRSVFLILPVVLLCVGQFTGLMRLSAWLLLALGVVIAAAAWWFMRRAFKGFTYEMLLK